MPTRLYMTTKMSEYADSTARGSWNTFYAPSLNYMIDTNKYGDPTTNHMIQAPVLAPGLYRTGLYRGITRRLMPQTISGQFNFLMFAGHIGGSTYLFTYLHIYVLNTTHGDGTGTVFQVLRTFESAHAWAKGASIFPLSLASNDPLFINPVIIPEDDQEYRLVVEFGGVTDSAVVGNLTTLHKLGVRNQNYVPLDDLSTQEGAPYFEFADDILFREFILPYNHELEFALQVGPPPRETITVTPYQQHPMWYKSPMSPGNGAVISARNCTTDRKAKVATFLQEETNLPPVLGHMITSDWNTVINYPVLNERTVYYKTWAELPTGPPFQLRLDIIDSSTDTEIGDFLLAGTDDIPNLYDPTIIGRFPAVIALSTPAGTIRTIDGKFPSSKLGVSLFAGRFGMVNEFSKELFIYGRAPLFKLIARVPTTLATVKAIGTDFISFFVLGGSPSFRAGETSLMYRIDHNGKFFPRPFVLAWADASPLMGVNRASTILYYGRNIADGKVQRHDLVTDSPMPEFANSPGPNYIPKYVIVMSDNTICCLFAYWPSPSDLNKLYHYAPDGTVLHSYTMDGFGTGTVVTYMSHTFDDDPDLVWVRHYFAAAPFLDTVHKFRLSNGTYVDGFAMYGYNNGMGPSDLPCNDLMWGPQIGGAMIPMMFVPDVSGVYFLNSDNKHDSFYYAIDLKIPDPTIRTAFIGE